MALLKWKQSREGRYRDTAEEEPAIAELWLAGRLMLLQKNTDGPPLNLKLVLAHLLAVPSRR